ncbi:hypothetical protein G9A89_016212 [Geosiphon pyriformis]|nr:hypothetical protein G9A89_016212 [Geosiphon pyriformis]
MNHSPPLGSFEPSTSEDPREFLHQSSNSSEILNILADIPHTEKRFSPMYEVTDFSLSEEREEIINYSSPSQETFYQKNPQNQSLMLSHQNKAIEFEQIDREKEIVFSQQRRDNAFLQDQIYSLSNERDHGLSQERDHSFPNEKEDNVNYIKHEEGNPPIITNQEDSNESQILEMKDEAKIGIVGKGLVETPPNANPFEIDPIINRLEMCVQTPDNQKPEVELTCSTSIDAPIQAQKYETSESIDELPSSPKLKPGAGEKFESKRDSEASDQTAQSDHAVSLISQRRKAADLFDVPTNKSISDPMLLDSEANAQESKIPQNESSNYPKRGSVDDGDNNDRESRRWRSRRSSSSHGDNERNDRRDAYSLRRISDAEFQALPSGSRLFLGNLSTHSTSKQELFDIFTPFGEILQISIKNSFGFVQYDNPESVLNAIERENGRVLHGLKLGLEVSHGKPWHHPSARDESPKGSYPHRHERSWSRGHKDDWYTHERGPSPPRGHHGPPYSPERRYEEYERRPSDHKFDRRASYDSPRGFEYPPDNRDYRLPPPEYRGNYKDDYDYRPTRGERGPYRRHSYREDHREERYAERSKPYRIPSREFHERRLSRDYLSYRSQSHDEQDDEFPLPRRQGNEVPECQIIVLEEIERNLLWEVERAFSEASISVHSIHLSRKKLHINSVVRQMIVEGVLAVVFLERPLVINGRVNMQVFDQSLRNRDTNVKYDEYENIRIDEAVGLLLRARASQRPIDMRGPDNIILGQPSNLPPPPPQQPPLSTGQPTNSGNVGPPLLSNVNFAALANLLGNLQQQQPGAPVLQSIPMNSINAIAQPSGMLPPQPPPPNIDVQQLLRQLAPQNPGLNNQPPFIPLPPHMNPNMGAPGPIPFNGSLVGQPNNGLPPNALTPNGLLSQQTLSANLAQFGSPITAPPNVSDLMAQFKQYSSQR